MRLPQIFIALVLAGLALPAAIASAGTCTIEKKAELTLSYADGFATAEAKINGAPVIMGLDTGAQTLVTPQTAADQKLMFGFSRMLARGATATIVADQVILRDLEFAGVHHKWKTVAKIKLPMAKTIDPKAKHVSGLLGMDVLADYDLDLDFPRRKLTLYSVRGCKEAPPRDFTGFSTVSFKFDGQRSVLFPVELDGKKLTALLDTGAMLHAITRPGAKKIGLTEAMLKADQQIEASGAGDIRVKIPLHTFGKLTAGGVELPNAQFQILTRPLGQADALIGQFYLLTRRVWISNAPRTLYIETKPQPGASTLEAGQAPAKATTLEEVCKGKAALRLGSFCEKGGEVPAAALAGGIPIQVQPSRQALLAPPPVRSSPAAPAGTPAQTPDPAATDQQGFLKTFTLEDVCRRTAIRQIREICDHVPQTIQHPEQASLPPQPAPPAAPQAAAFGYIGVGYVGISPSCGKALGVSAGSGSGVMVRGFATASAGEKAGLRRGDIVVALNSEPVAGASGFREAMRKTAPGQTLKLTVWRDKAETTREVQAASSQARPGDELGLDGRAAYQTEAGEALLERLPQDGCPEERAISMIFLGGAHGRRAAASGGAAEHSEQAIEYITKGLSALSQTKFPAVWAEAHAQLGDVYRLKATGDKAANIENAVKAYEEALEVRDANLPRDARGATLLGLGLALVARGQGNRSENIERAIANFEQARLAFDSKANMKRWADLHRALAGAYLERSEGQRQQNIDAAIAALESASGAYHLAGETADKGAVQAQLMLLRAQRASVRP